MQSDPKASKAQYNPLNQQDIETASHSSEDSANASLVKKRSSDDGDTTNFPADNAGSDALLDTAEVVGAMVEAIATGQADVTAWLNLNYCARLTPQQIGYRGLAAIGQIIYFTSAIQPALNGWTAFEWLFAQHKCPVGEPECYIQWHGFVSVFVYLFVFCTFYANYRIALEFMPDTFKAIWDLLKFMGKQALLRMGIRDNELPAALNSTLLISGVILLAALILAGSGATVTFELGRESLVLFKATWIWMNTALLATAVASTLSTRFISCRAMLHIFYQRQLAYMHMDAPLRLLGYDEAADFYEQRRWLLTGYFDTYFYEYRLPPAIWDSVSHLLKQVEGQVQVSGQKVEEPTLQDYVTVFKTLYSRSEDGSWPGLLAHVQSTRLKQAAYYLALSACYFFAFASYPIIYNITRKAFSEWAPWHDLSYVVVLASTLFYIYAIGRLPDQIAREVMMSATYLAEKKCSRWGMFSWSMLMGIASCGNFLYSALSQADDDLLDHLGLTHEQAMIFFPIVGAVISGGCNLYATLSIDERHAVPERYHNSAKIFKKLNGFTEDSSIMTASYQESAANIIEEAYHQHYPSSITEGANRYFSSWCTFASPNASSQYKPLINSGEFIEQNNDNIGSEVDDFLADADEVRKMDVRA